MNIEQKIFHYKETKWNIPFRELNHTIVTVCEWVKPIYPNIKPLKYFEYFFTEIDFDKIYFNKIDITPTKYETLKYCKAIYHGLEQLLKADISKAILNYQNNISKLPKEQIKETQIKLIELIGNLKRQARTNEAGISFDQCYNALYKSIEAKEKLLPIDYQILISHFNETILNDLLSSFEIINETFKEIIPLLETLHPLQIKNEANQPSLEIKPIFNPDVIETIFDVLKDFFDIKQHLLLKQLLENGNNASEYLIFLGNGNKLADAFKQLIKTNFITGCEQKELEKWICLNFKYRYRQKIKEFTLKYLNDIISTNWDKCKTPIISIKKGTIEKA